ncbi:MAG: pyridoxal-phosphate dependent enzyme [Gemmatimonadetes bacterium]|nr:pyridoxal-phosphate dependent enzyme [Gemmatimonadota bacterium]
MDFRARLATASRLRLAIVPTPLRPVPALERWLDASVGAAAPRLLVKHDDQTGFGLGGNKVRKLEYELAPDRLEGVTCIVTTGGPQSNHARVTAAAAAWLGLECVIVTNGAAPEPFRGNALLQRRFGARIETVSGRDERAPTMERIADEVAAAGGRARVVPLGASTAHGALGYVRAFMELDDELEPGGPRTWVFVSASSGGTLAGLHLGRALCGRDDVTLVAVSADTPAGELRAVADRLATEAATLLGVEARLDAERLVVVDDQVGEGYGLPTAASTEAASVFARRAGVILDDTYTAKAAAGLLAALRSGTVAAPDRVVFWHTGGWPAVFA